MRSDRPCSFSARLCDIRPLLSRSRDDAAPAVVADDDAAAARGCVSLSLNVSNDVDSGSWWCTTGAQAVCDADAATFLMQCSLPMLGVSGRDVLMTGAGRLMKERNR